MRKAGNDCSFPAFLAPLARLERTTFRLGVWLAVSCVIRIMTSNYFSCIFEASSTRTNYRKRYIIAGFYASVRMSKYERLEYETKP